MLLVVGQEMKNIPGMNDCGDCGKSNASVVYPPRQTRIYSRLFYTPVFSTPLYMLYMYSETAPDIHSRLSIMSQCAHSAFVECKHIFSVFVCISCGKRATKTVSQFATYNVHNSNLSV